MPKVIGVRFRTSPRMYYFAPTDGDEYEKGMKIVVETQRGVELATVIMPTTEIPEEKLVAPLKGILRIATESDIEAASADEQKKQEIIFTAKQKVAARGLNMKIVDCEFTVDHSKLVLYFTAEQRVDFRELVRDLASAFHMRIDLRQIGARDECKLVGSLGACGLPCCCGRFESDSEHVSIKMAKNQNLALTPNKINGMCGRLLCCLSYENKTYEEVAKRSPKVGSWVTCPDGRRGTVVSVTPLTEKVRVRVGDDDNFEFAEFDLSVVKYDRNKQKDGEDGSAAEQRPNNGDERRSGKQGKNNGDRKQFKQKDKNGRGSDSNTNAQGDRNGAQHGGNGQGGKRKKRRFDKNGQGDKGGQNGNGTAKPQE